MHGIHDLGGMHGFHCELAVAILCVCSMLCLAVALVAVIDSSLDQMSDLYFLSMPNLSVWRDRTPKLRPFVCSTSSCRRAADWCCT